MRIDIHSHSFNFQLPVVDPFLEKVSLSDLGKFFFFFSSPLIIYTLLRALINLLEAFRVFIECLFRMNNVECNWMEKNIGEIVEKEW